MDYGYDMDPVDFQMYGYGGFGYDTSHVPKDDPEPKLVTAATSGHLPTVRRMIDRADGKKLRRLLNDSRRWTEVDYKMSGFTKEWEWHGLTPLAAAALNGHANVVRALLETGEADPTLEGCPTDDEYYDAFKAADKAKAVGKKGAEDVQRMLSAVRPFWECASYSKSHYSKGRVECGFSNSCKDVAAMRKALKEI